MIIPLPNLRIKYHETESSDCFFLLCLNFSTSEYNHSESTKGPNQKRFFLLPKQTPPGAPSFPSSYGNATFPPLVEIEYRQKMGAQVS